MCRREVSSMWEIIRTIMHNARWYASMHALTFCEKDGCFQRHYRLISLIFPDTGCVAFHNDRDIVVYVNVVIYPNLCFPCIPHRLKDHLKISLFYNNLLITCVHKLWCPTKQARGIVCKNIDKCRFNCTVFVIKYISAIMMSSNGNIFRVTGPLWGEFTGHRWIPGTKASDAELRCFLWSACHRAHYDVAVMNAVDIFLQHAVLWIVTSPNHNTMTTEIYI